MNADGELPSQTCLAHTHELAVPHTSVLLGYYGGNLLFDCGEGTLAQLRQVYSQVPDSDSIDHIVLSSLNAESSWGLPSVLLDLHSRRKSRPHLALPTIYGPRGISNQLRVIFKNMGRSLEEYSSGVVEFPEEYYRDDLTRPNARVAQFKGNYENPWSFGISRIEQRTQPTFGMVFFEPHGSRFDPAKAAALNIPSSYWPRLQAGEKVEVPGLGLIPPERTASNRRGRKVALLGSTTDPYNVSHLAYQADVVVADACFQPHPEGSSLALHSRIPDFMGNVNARSLILTGIPDPALVAEFLADAEEKVAQLKAQLKDDPAARPAVLQGYQLFFSLVGASNRISLLQLSALPSRQTLLSKFSSLAQEISRIMPQIDLAKDDLALVRPIDHFSPYALRDPLSDGVSTFFPRSEASQFMRVHIEDRK